jgi:hypothetical protein
MLDTDLAELYGVETFNLNKAVKRNIDRFPSDFMFQVTKDEIESLRFQFGISKTSGRGGRRYLPYAFTEQGVAMLSGILNSQRAVHVNIAIMRTFVKLRELLTTHKDLANKETLFALHQTGRTVEAIHRFGIYAMKDMDIISVGRRPNTRYGIGMDKGKIEIVY